MAHYNRRKFIQTVTMIIFLHTIEHRAVAKIVCELKKYRDVQQASCIFANLTKIPDDIDANIESIDVSGNPIAEIRRSDLIKYGNLKSFFYEGSGPVKIELNAFVDLHRLEQLTIYNIKIGQNGLIILPMTIKIFHVINAGLVSEYLDLSKLENLFSLDITSNLLTVFPKIHEYAPLKYLKILNNPFEAVYISSLVRYCKLQTVYVNYEVIEKAASISKNKCECPRWLEWFRRRRIYGLDEGLPCSANDCSEELIPKEWDQSYNDCVQRMMATTLAPLLPTLNIKPDVAPITPSLSVQPTVQADQKPVNITPAPEKKPLSKLLFILMLVLAFVTILSAMCVYLIRRKIRSPASIDDEYQNPNAEEDNDDEDDNE